MNLGLRREFTGRFLITDVDIKVFAVVLFSHYELLVDCRNNHLLTDSHRFLR